MDPITTICIFVLGLAAALIFLPYILPVPPLKNPKTTEALVDPDGRFIRLDGVKVHYKQQGQGSPVFLLLHGFGASTYSWHAVMTRLSEFGTVIAYDRPAFGLTERPMPGDWDNHNPYTSAAQVKTAVELLNVLGVDRVVLVGHSAGGAVAAGVAVKYPQRVRGLILVDAAVYRVYPNLPILRKLLKTRWLDRVGQLLVRRVGARSTEFLRKAWHAPEKIPAETYVQYQLPLEIENWDRSLWELSKHYGESRLEGGLASLKMPVLVISGDDDRIIPLSDSQKLAAEIPGSRLVVINDCGHVPQEETPQEFLGAVESFLDEFDLVKGG